MELNFNTETIISLAAVLVMFYCLFLVLTLKKHVPGGVVGKQWNILTMLVVVFSVGYLAIPFFGTLPPELASSLVSLIFFFGAMYVVVTIKLIYRIIEELVA